MCTQLMPTYSFSHCRHPRHPKHHLLVSWYPWHVLWHWNCSSCLWAPLLQPCFPACCNFGKLFHSRISTIPKLGQAFSVHQRLEYAFSHNKLEHHLSLAIHSHWASWLGRQTLARHIQAETHGARDPGTKAIKLFCLNYCKDLMNG